MAERKIYDLIILGAGISGLTAADACTRMGFNCAVVDTGNPGSGASGAPLGLLNPAAGRRAKKGWRAEEALTSTLELMKRVQSGQKKSFYSLNGVIRPAPGSKIAGEMRRQFDNTEWPRGWARWLDRENLEKCFPGINNSHGGLSVPVAATVSLAGFIGTLSRDLQSRGVSMYTDSSYKIKSRDSWEITLPDCSIQSPRLLNATGYNLVSDPDWKFLPLHGVKGQLLNLELKAPFPLKSSVSSRGYIAVMPDNRKQITLGSTYEHSFETTEPDESMDRYLLERQEENWPILTDMITDVKRWSAVRVTTPDHKPVAGCHPTLKNLYVIGGLGSKGLMVGPLTARYLISHMFQGTDLPEEIDLKRFL